jgi:hypothetical protein
MSTDLEQDLRELFAADAARAPRAVDLAAGARSRAAARRRAQRRIAVGASVVVAVSVVSSVALLSGSTSHQPVPLASNRPDPSTSQGSSSSLGPVVPEAPALYYRNVEVPVPAAMLTSRLDADCPVSDAAYVVDYGPACSPKPDQRHVTTVVLQPWQAGPNVPAPPSGTHILTDGRTQMVTAVPGSDLRLVVTSPDPKVAARLFGGLRIVDMVHGCPVRDTAGVNLTPPYDSDEGTPEGGSVCGYQGGWLVGSSWLTPNQSKDMAALLTEPVPTVIPCPTSSSPPLIDSWRVHLRFPTGEVVVEVAAVACSETALTDRLWELAEPPIDEVRTD